MFLYKYLYIKGQLIMCDQLKNNRDMRDEVNDRQAGFFFVLFVV